MSKSLTRIFYVIGIVLIIIGSVLLAIGASGSTTTTTSGGTTVSTLGNATLFWIGFALIMVGCIPILIAWIGAIVKMIQLQQWVWLVLLIVFSGITLLVYIFAGPTQPANRGVAGPYSGYPPQPQQ